MVSEANCMSFPCTELLLFNCAKVKTVFHSMAPLNLHLWPWTTKPVKRLHFFIFGWDTTVWTSEIAFKVVQIKFLAMHIIKQNLSFDIFTVGNVQNNFMEHDVNLIS